MMDSDQAFIVRLLASQSLPSLPPEELARLVALLSSFPRPTPQDYIANNDGETDNLVSVRGRLKAIVKFNKLNPPITKIAEKATDALRGRPQHYDEREDARIAKAYHQNGNNTKTTARLLGITSKAVKSAVDRHRKRASE
ncbi:MAG: hypothetical protein HYX69_06960 [Planctomycetia bacterium]|nr:hypothetical protein [Planctomycetia bacterium]